MGLAAKVHRTRMGCQREGARHKRGRKGARTGREHETGQHPLPRPPTKVGLPQRGAMTPERSANRRRRTVHFLRKRLPAQVGRYLQGVRFPARKEELRGRLERNGVPGPVLGQLRKRLPEGEYRGPQDVLAALRRGR